MGNAASTDVAHRHMPNHSERQLTTISSSTPNQADKTLTTTTTTPPSSHTHTHLHHPHHVSKSCSCIHMHPGRTCLSFIVSSFGRSFYLAYGIKAGITLLLHVIKLLRSKQPSRIFDLNQLVSAQGLPIDAVRMGLFFGGFTGLYNGCRCLLARWTGRDDKHTVMLSGLIAGASIVFQPKDTHRTLALYAWARVLQCWYNKSKAEKKWHLWGSDWAHGDSLLFSVCTAQIMYAYVMRPDTLPPAYWKFIVDTGPIPIPVLKAAQMNNRGLPIDLQVLKGVYEKLAPKGSKPLEGILSKLATDAYGPNASPLLPPLLPCSILHAHNPSCSHQWFETFLNGAKRSLPIYLSLTFVPMFVLRFWLLIKHPFDQIQKGLWSVTKSTSFLSSFVTVYMFLVCMHRRTFTRDHRALYWLSGFVASWTILLESKSRRSELALYVLPRTLDSLIQTMQHRKMLADIPHGEKGLFMLGMGALMYYREYHCDTMSPLLRRVLNFFVPTYKSLPTDHPNRLTASSTAATTASSVSSSGHPDGVVTVDTTTPLVRVESDGGLLSSSSVNSVMPLPQPGVSFSREQSFLMTPTNEFLISASPPTTTMVMTNTNTILESIDDTDQQQQQQQQQQIDTNNLSSSVAASSSPLLPSPNVNESASTLSSIDDSSIIGDTVSQSRVRTTSFVEEKVDAIEKRQAAEAATAAATTGKVKDNAATTNNSNNNHRDTSEQTAPKSNGGKKGRKGRH